MSTEDDSTEESTRLLLLAADGDQDAARLLVPHVFEQLRAAARRQLATERADHTLSATALVHEAYIKLAGPREIPWSGRGHFYSAAADAMRRILVDHARARATTKRGGADVRRAALDLTALPDLRSDEQSAGFLILHDAIDRLEEVDAEAAEVVRLRYFAGLSVAETATALERSEATVKRAWTFARGWLKEAIESRRV
ncbi:MAG: ECF-type sigma factor [Planctomycetota bacterium]